MDIKENRKLRLEELIDEFGSAAEVARRGNTAASYLSTLLSSSGGRKIGDEVARKIEVGCGKPKGWMDIPVGKNFSFSEDSSNSIPPLLSRSSRKLVQRISEMETNGDLNDLQITKLTELLEAFRTSKMKPDAKENLRRASESE